MSRRGTARKLWLGSLLMAGFWIAAFILSSLYVGLRYSHFIVKRASAPHVPVAIVFGAGLHDGAPSPVLAERLEAARDLWRRGKVQRLLLTGDNSDRYHDETRAMRRYLEARGVPGDILDEDFGGLSTYDSCVRARSVFGVHQALLVTQAFHLPRALFIARSVGIEASGVEADEGRRARHRYLLRELFGRPLALAMVWAQAAPAFPSGRTPPHAR